MVNYYSQEGEDCLLWQIFHTRKSGFYVDVGAFDGIHLSNSYLFEQQGWQGVCIEPHPLYYQKCRQNRPGAVCLHAACVGAESISEITFYTEAIGLFSGVIGGRQEDVKRRYVKRQMDFNDFEENKIAAKTLNSILAAYLPDGMHLNFVSIDVEGSELDVLKGFDIERYHPDVLVLEANSVEARQILSSYLKPLGYFDARKVGDNVFYAASRALARKIANQTIDCILEKNFHPLGEEFTALKHKQSRRVKLPSSRANFWRNIKNKLKQLVNYFRSPQK
jgi:FkbM family methyltransferase